MKKAILFGVLAGGVVAVGVSYVYREQLKARLLDVIEAYRNAEEDRKLVESQEFTDATESYRVAKATNTDTPILYPQPDEPVRPGAGAYEDVPNRSMHHDFKE